MRNNIYRNFLKKILKSEAFVSLAIVFVLALGIIGTSYALYMDVDTDTDYQVVKVGDLNIAFDKGDNTFSIANVTPTDDEIGSQSKDNLFSFYIVNAGTYTANYSLKLVPDYNEPSPNEIDPEYIRFQICKDNYENCKDIETLSDFVTVDENKNITDSKAIYIDELSPNKSNQGNNGAYYFIRMWLTSEGYGTEEYNTNIIGKTIKYKVNVEAKNASGLYDNTNTLAGRLLNDDRVTINNTVPTFDGIADYKVTGDPTSGELGMFKAEDDYGISYYYRGAQSHNYVNFAGFTWRVVRINGDGSIRLILDGTLDKVEKDGQAVHTNSKLASIDSDGIVSYNTLNDDFAYIGYMYGEFEGNSTSYDEAHQNINDSTIKKYVDAFYEEYIVEQEMYLSDTIFCADKTSSNEKIYGTLENNIYFSGYERVFNGGVSKPTLKCVSSDLINNKNLTEEQLSYSRYTSKLDNAIKTKKDVLVNNDLKYPIALLSSDEMVMAGAYELGGNVNYYLFDAYVNYGISRLYEYWWNITPAYNYNEEFAVLGSFVEIFSLYVGNVDFTGGVRPVINLKSDVLWASGDGTIDTPYEVKLY